MFSMLSSISAMTIVSLASFTVAISCGGGGSFYVSDISDNFGDKTLNPESQSITQQSSGQICIVNKAPNTAVTLSASQINDAIALVISDCCGNEYSCSGGQDKITADSGNVIDLSVQALGQGCST